MGILKMGDGFWVVGIEEVVGSFFFFFGVRT